MATDMIAQAMAMDAAKKAGDSYTKPETNALLAAKANTSDVTAALADKADLSILTPMTQAQYDAIVTKTAPLYFIYEDGEGT